MSNIISTATANVVVDHTPVIADANAVVLHDIAAVNAATQQPNFSAYKELEALALAKSDWEHNAYRTSNDQLYGLLQKCYGLYKLICADPATAKSRIEEIDAYLNKEHNAKLSASAHTITKIVKAVFGADRRRVSAYSIALRAALDAKIAVDRIPQYIRENGGVEELRLAKSPNAKTAKQKAEDAKTTVDKSVLAKLTLDALVETLDAARVGTQHVLIVTQAADGALNVNALVSATSAVNAALAAYYTQNKAEATAAAKDSKAESDDAAQAKRIEEAAVAALH
jgi:hypothetical protein